MICQRCGKDSRINIGSYFDTSTICLECRKKEEQHPDFEKARAAEAAAVKAGNYNFPGIGKPADL